MRNNDLPIALNKNNYKFPDVDKACKNPNGLLAVGGDLAMPRLIEAYRNGIFPWYSDGQPLLWWSPDPRAVLYLDKLKVSRSLKKTIKQNKFRITIDQAFYEVVEACATIPRQGQEGSWITLEMQHAYAQLYRARYAHSIEAWYNDELAGGLYGICIGPYFFGESMFSRQTDASKVALFHLSELLKSYCFRFIDCQVPNPHLSSLGVSSIERKVFIKDLKKHIDDPIDYAVWRETF